MVIFREHVKSSFNMITGVRCMSVFGLDLHNTTKVCEMCNVHSTLCYCKHKIYANSTF